MVNKQENRSVGLRIVVAVALLAMMVGCLAQPKIKPDYVGINDLAVQRSDAPNQDLPPFPDATELPLLPRESAVERPGYPVGPLDELVIMVWGRDDLGSQVPVGANGELRASVVGENGTVVMPFLGGLKVAGKTIDEIRTDIQERYSRVIESPQVDVKLRSCASQTVEVSGEVTRPGSFALCNDVRTVADVMMAAGGTTDNTDLVRGLLTRAGTPYHLDYDKGVRGENRASDIILQHGDQIYFPQIDDRVVYIFGEVGKPGIYPIPDEGMTLLGALARARGADAVSSKPNGIYLIRHHAEGPIAYQLGMSQLLQGPEVPLTNGDRLFVAMRPLERWDRWWRMALPFTTVRTNVEVVPE